MADTAVDTIAEIVSSAGGTTDAKTVIPALEDLGALIGGGGGGGGTIADGSITTSMIANGAVTAEKLASNIAPSGMYYGTSSTPGSSTTKVVVCDGFSLTAGARITVKFSGSNKTNSMFPLVSLNVNSTGTKDVLVNGKTVSIENPLSWGEGAVLSFVYDGTNWLLDDKAATYVGSTATDAGEITKDVTLLNATSGVVLMNGTMLLVRFINGNSNTGTKNINVDGIQFSTVTTQNTDPKYICEENTYLTFAFMGCVWVLV